MSYNPYPLIPSQDEKTMAIVMWGISVFSSFLGPIIFLIVSRNQRFVYASAAQALVFHAVLAVAVILGSILTFGLGAFILAPIAFILGIGIPVLAILSISAGRFYDVPVVGAWARRLFSA